MKKQDVKKQIRVLGRMVAQELTKEELEQTQGKACATSFTSPFSTCRGGDVADPGP